MSKQKPLLNEYYSINKQCVCVVFCHQNAFLHHEKSFLPTEHKKIELHFNLLAFQYFSLYVAIFLGRRFFSFFSWNASDGGGEEWVSQNSNYGKMGGSVFEVIFRMFMTFLKVIKKKIDKHSCKMFFLYFLKPKLSFTALERIIFMMYFCKNNLQFGHTKFDHPIYESMHVCISYIFL